MENGQDKGYGQIIDQMKRTHVEYTLEQEDDASDNHTYKEEQVLLEVIRHGDVERAKINVNVDFPKYPQAVSYSQKRNEEYMAVVVIALSARAAIEGGVTSQESFALSDVYLRRVAATQTIEDIIRVRNSAIISFTELVAARRAKKRSRSYVEDCKKYIASHIFKKISVSDIADELALNSVYLERIFKESEGISISRYIQKEKINRAQNLLVYSDRSIMEISDYLSFSSQSHFGKVFRQETGMTPRQYREVNHMTGF